MFVICLLWALEKEIKMTEEEALERLEDLIEMEDVEKAHYLADKVLIDFIRNLGYTEVVDLWKQVEKWYA